MPGALRRAPGDTWRELGVAHPDIAGEQDSLSVPTEQRCCPSPLKGHAPQYREVIPGDIGFKCHWKNWGSRR